MMVRQMAVLMSGDRLPYARSSNCLLKPALLRALTIVLAMASSIATADQALPTGWTPFGALENGCNGRIRAIARLADGDYVVGGAFSNCSGTAARHVARYSPVENVWSALGDGTDGQVLALAVHGDQLYAAGVFAIAGDIQVSGIARWDGQAWHALGAGVPTGFITVLAVAGPELYVGGSFTTVGNGVAANNLARWDGQNWSVVGTGVANGTDGTVNALSAASGRLCAGGRFNQAGGIAARQVACWDGLSWSALGVGLSGTVHALAEFDGSLYAGGDLQAVASAEPSAIARWDGQAWTPLGSNTRGLVFALAVSANTLYAGGHFSTDENLLEARVARWDGSTWNSIEGVLDSALQASVHALAVDAEGVMVGGDFDEAGGAPANAVARWGDAGWQRLGHSAGLGLNGVALQLLETGDGSLLIGGTFSQAGHVPSRRIAHWSDAGWATLAGGQLDGIASALAWAHGELHVGKLNSAGGVVVDGIARWNGQRWAALAGDGNSAILGEVIALLGGPDDLFVGGQFTQAGGVMANGVARWDGSQWSSLGNGASNGVISLGGGNSGEVWALARLDEDIYVGGLFAHAGGIPARNIARWDGEHWHALGAGVDSAVLALTAAGGRLYVGGSFQTAGGIGVGRVAVWDGQQWSRIGSASDHGVNDHVHDVVLAGQELYIGGSFTQLSTGEPASHIARWDGARWSSLGSSNAEGVDGRVETLVLQGEYLYAAGAFKHAGGAASQGIARWRHLPEALFASGFETTESSRKD